MNKLNLKYFLVPLVSFLMLFSVPVRSALISGCIPSKLGPYYILRVLGRGHHGTVVEAMSSDRNQVALKIIRDNNDWDTRRFLHEHRLYQKINEMPEEKREGIVTVYELGKEEGFLYFAMDVISGMTLSERQALFPLSDLELSKVMRNIAVAIQSLHKAGVVHRDLKPENIMVSYDLKIKVFDFGVGKFLEYDEFSQSFEHTIGTLGALRYTAPELRNYPNSGNSRSDLFSLGALVSELLMIRKNCQSIAF
jgi:eukaryotic-like serine/threonine-protein kinase